MNELSSSALFDSLKTVGIFSRGLLRMPGLAAFVGNARFVARPTSRQARDLDAVLGWGHKPTADRARGFAREHSLPYIALEDGFLRSVGLGPQEPPLSLVLDDLGIYYDAREPSRLEAMLAFEGEQDPLADEALVARARRCRERIVEAGLSKYNHTPVGLPEAFRARGREMVLVVDQTYDDASVLGGLADAETFSRMLSAARRDHPHARILVKVHPDTLEGRKRGYLAERLRGQDVEVLRDPINPVALLREVSHVYVCSSQVGFEALLVGKPVVCFGAPFYAGWGLTHDRVRMPRRGRRRSLDALVAAALLRYPRYVHPMSGRRCEAEEVIEHLALQRRMFEKNARSYFCLGFTRWKRPYIRKFLHSPGHEVRFADSWADLLCMDKPAGSAIVIWGCRERRRAVRGADGTEVPVYVMEDGFLRSVRLGSELTAPGSLVLDRKGIYYDPSAPSDLEEILAQTRFSQEDLFRAAALRERIVALGVSKYNLPSHQAIHLADRPGQQVILVPGQVPDDASVKRGSPRVQSDADLLRAVRQLRPDAHVVYKPHPDVLSGNRRGELVGALSGLWDERVDHVSIADCLRLAGEVHTMTSLVGFEALLRGVPVVTHGQPFYAGWGLTQDRCPIPRRGRDLSVDELVAGVLLRYPWYFSWRVRAYCRPEHLVDDLAAGGSTEGGRFRFPWVLRRARDVSRLVWDWMHV